MQIAMKSICFCSLYVLVAVVDVCVQVLTLCFSLARCLECGKRLNHKLGMDHGIMKFKTFSASFHLTVKSLC